MCVRGGGGGGPEPPLDPPLLNVVYNVYFLVVCAIYRIHFFFFCFYISINMQRCKNRRQNVKIKGSNT